jgi:aldose 1-epimerase
LEFRSSTRGRTALQRPATALRDERWTSIRRRHSCAHDEHGLLIHGVPWSQLAWTVTEASQGSVAAQLEWNDKELLAVFPFQHRVDLTATLRPDGLMLETTLVAGPDGPVPVSFGFHPYFGLPGLSRTQWRLELPEMRRLTLDGRGILTGEEVPFDGFDADLGDLHFDDGFAILGERASLAVAGAGCRISVDLLAGYGYAQIYAPKDKDYLALKPMTAPTSALTSGRGLGLVEPGGKFRAAFQIRLDTVRRPENAGTHRHLPRHIRISS